MLDRQSQSAGPNAQQVQVAGDLVVVAGVTEQRAHEIAKQTAQNVIAEYAAEGRELADGRIGRFDVALVQRLSEQGVLGALADPAFQVLLRKAQIGAACTDRDSDYEMLASLLSDRVARGEDRRLRAGISRAVEVVDQLDGPALTGLTVVSAAVQYRPLVSEPDAGIDTMERLMGQLMIEQELPEGQDWIDHLDVLDAVRIGQSTKWLPFDQFWPNKTGGYVCSGVESDSELLRPAIEELAAAGVSLQPVPHQYRPGFVRLPFSDIVDLEKALTESDAVSEDQAQTVLRVARDTFRLDTQHSGALAAYMGAVRQREQLRRLADWWEQLPVHFVITPVGRVLARANAQRLDGAKLLPPID